MTRIIEHRQDAAPGEELFELRVFQLRDGDVRACVVSADLAVDLDMMADMSEPVAQAYLDALALCETESVATLWVHDPLGSFRHAIDRSRNCDEPACPPVTPPRGSEPRSPSRAEPVRERLRRPDLIDRVTGSGAGIDNLVVQGRREGLGSRAEGSVRGSRCCHIQFAISKNSHAPNASTAALRIAPLMEPSTLSRGKTVQT